MKISINSAKTWTRYLANKFEYSSCVSEKKCNAGQINAEEFADTALRIFFSGKMTFLHWTKGEEMAPIITSQGGTLLVRRIESTYSQISTPISVGDVILLKNPEKPDDYIFRRLAAVEGYEMASKNGKDEPFVLEEDQCWVVSDNEALNTKEAKDSRLFGPVSKHSIAGRVIYAMRSAVDHGPVQNSSAAMKDDAAILAVELDVDEMQRNNN